MNKHTFCIFPLSPHHTQKNPENKNKIDFFLRNHPKKIKLKIIWLYYRCKILYRKIMTIVCIIDNSRHNLDLWYLFWIFWNKYTRIFITEIITVDHLIFFFLQLMLFLPTNRRRGIQKKPCNINGVADDSIILLNVLTNTTHWLIYSLNKPRNYFTIPWRFLRKVLKI